MLKPVSCGRDGATSAYGPLIIRLPSLRAEATRVAELLGAGHMPAPGEDEREEAKLFYVGATRAAQRLIIGMSGDGGFGRRLSA